MFNGMPSGNINLDTPSMLTLSRQTTRASSPIVHPVHCNQVTRIIKFCNFTTGELSVNFITQDPLLSPELSNLQPSETPAMTALNNKLPKDVVPPGSQTGIYYIPISNVCEAQED